MPAPRPPPGQKTLIPESVLDVPTQRLYAVSAFFLLQAWKLYEVVSLYTSTEGDLGMAWTFKWMAFDGLFLTILPLLSIPWLSFQQTTTIIQICIICLLDFGVSMRVQIPLGAIFWGIVRLFYDKELALSGNRVSVNDIIYNSSHILGRYTVNLLPESTAKLNPAASAFCLGESINEVVLPIRLNSTVPIYLQYSRTDLETSEKTYFNVTGGALKDIMSKVEDYVPERGVPSKSAKSKVKVITLEIAEPGLYKLERVIDKSKMDVRLYQSSALVVECPTASFHIAEGARNRPDRCTGDFDELTLKVRGVAPLTVKYNQWIGKRRSTTTFDSIHPSTGFQSPLLNSDSDTVALHNLDDYSWASATVTDLLLNSTLHTSGAWTYEIEEVTDAVGNVVSHVADRRSQDEKESVDSLRSFRFNVHERPELSFGNCDADRPIKLLKGRTARLPISLKSSDLPVGARVGYVNSTSIMSEPDPASLDYDILQMVELSGRHDYVEAQRAGVYYLLDVKSQFCRGRVMSPSACVVYTPPEPAVSVAFEEIKDKCAGSIGVTADLTFMGAPPFEVAYRITKDKKHVQVNRVKISRSRHQLKFMPEEAGHYDYQFLSLDDDNYIGVPLDSKTFQTEAKVFPLAGASFVDAGRPSQHQTCIGGTVDLDVKLIGMGPWKLTYDIIHDGQRQQYSADEITTPVYKITTPPLTGGSHTVTLVSIEDSHGCKTMLGERDAVVEVRRQRPTAAFNGGAVRTTAGSRVKLPVRLTGDAPWEVKYTVPSLGSLPVLTVIRDPNGFIEAEEEGEYEIVEVKDRYCPGFVSTTHHKAAVEWLERPSLSLGVDAGSLREGDVYTRKSVCEGAEDVFEISCRGLSPFTVDYEIIHAAEDGKELSREHRELTVPQETASIRMHTGRAGMWRYEFKGISDARYSTPSAPNVTDGKGVLVLEQIINPRPEARFAEAGKVYRFCSQDTIDDQTDLETIPLTFNGKAPFAVTFDVKHDRSGETESFVVNEVRSPEYALRVPREALTLGDHVIMITQVSDANGCIRSRQDHAQKVTVSVTEPASIVPIDNRIDYCVGDRIGFALQGTPPFDIEYVFDGKKRVAVASTSAFSRVAERPGIFTVVALSDHVNNCKVAVDLSKTIHDLPSVRIREGLTVVEDIHEGDQAEITFHFTGTAPFSFTYVRSETKKGKRRVLETHTVTDVNSDHYTIFTSQHGDYEVLEVRDAW
ncbi:hypothetical protein YB2330_001892 [Saitoella coloradoensis]